jgi:bifunctional NMN adenylyltransferase/nudix hydrolase
MIARCLSADDLERVHFVSVRDYPGQDDLWVNDIRGKVVMLAPPGADIKITGYRKDKTTYYLTIFPEWDSEWLETTEMMSATDVRTAYFGGSPWRVWSANLPGTVVEYLDQFKHTQLYRRLAADQKQLQSSARAEHHRNGKRALKQVKSRGTV